MLVSYFIIAVQSAIMLSVIMLSIIMLSVIMLSVIMLSIIILNVILLTRHIINLFASLKYKTICLAFVKIC
jgi:hypothetical protein